MTLMGVAWCAIAEDGERRHMAQDYLGGIQI